LRNIFDSGALNVLPIYPTYQHSLTYNPTWLDLPIVNNVDHVVNYGKNNDHGISKHSIIFLSYYLIIPKRKVKYITCRNIKIMNLTAFYDDVIHMSWNDVNQLSSVNDEVDLLKSMIMNIYDKHVPYRRCRITHKPRPWLNESWLIDLFFKLLYN
jgi:hypothetical protein